MTRDKINQIVAALVEAINASTRPPALYPIARLKYPPRGVFVDELPDGSMVVRLAKYGYEYKHRGPKPKTPPAVNVAEIFGIFSNTLTSVDVTVTAVVDDGTQISIYVKEE